MSRHVDTRPTGMILRMARQCAHLFQKRNIEQSEHSYDFCISLRFDRMFPVA